MYWSLLSRKCFRAVKLAAYLIRIRCDPDDTSRNNLFKDPKPTGLLCRGRVDPMAAHTDQTLTDAQRGILDFERQWWRYTGGKAVEIQQQLEMTPVTYYRELNAIIDLPGALEYDPTLVRRLQRARTLTRRRRSARGIRLAPA